MFIKNKCKNTFLEVQGKVRWDLGSPAVWTLPWRQGGAYVTDQTPMHFGCVFQCTQGAGVSLRKCREDREVWDRATPSSLEQKQESGWFNNGEFKCPGLAGREKGKHPSSWAGTKQFWVLFLKGLILWEAQIFPRGTWADPTLAITVGRVV